MKDRKILYIFLSVILFSICACVNAQDIDPMLIKATKMAISEFEKSELFKNHIPLYMNVKYVAKYDINEVAKNYQEEIDKKRTNDNNGNISEQAYKKAEKELIKIIIKEKDAKNEKEAKEFLKRNIKPGKYKVLIPEYNASSKLYTATKIYYYDDIKWYDGEFEIEMKKGDNIFVDGCAYLIPIN